MSSKMIPTADLTVQFHSKPRSEIPKQISTISFNSQAVGSRIRTGKQSGARRAARVEAAYAPAAETKETLYELLGIGESGSSFSDIRKAYREMARKYHPDVSPPERADEYTQRFIMVHEAYETLSNPQRRALYDRGLAHDDDHLSVSHDLQGMEWKMRWQSQLDQLEQRDSGGRTSWGARMRNTNSTH